MLGWDHRMHASKILGLLNLSTSISFRKQAYKIFITLNLGVKRHIF